MPSDYIQLQAPWAVKQAHRARAQVASNVDGRFGIFDVAAFDRAIDFLVENTALGKVDCVLGIPEGGLVPAYAFARRANVPVLFATRFRPATGQFVTFQEEHDGVTGGRHITGLTPGSRILIVEDEISTGRTAVNCVHALRDAGMTCDTVASIYAADRVETRELLALNGITLVAAALFGAELLSDLYR